MILITIYFKINLSITSADHQFLTLNQGFQMPYSGNVHEILLDGKKIILIGTAHISQSSVDEVNTVINQVKPDTQGFHWNRLMGFVLSKYLVPESMLYFEIA